MLTGRKLPLFLTIVAVMGLAVAVGCKGFFQNPTLTSITVGPTGQNVQVSQTLQMAARGTYDDGSVKVITGQVAWGSDDTSVATVNSTGLVTGVSSGTANISASKDAITGSAAVTIVLNGVTGITVSPKNAQVPPGGSQNFTCMASVSGQNPVDVTSSVDWTLSDTSGHTSITNGQDPAVFTADNQASGTITVTATYTVGSTQFIDTATVTIQ